MDSEAARIFPLHEQVLNDTCSDVYLIELLDGVKNMLLLNELAPNFVEYIELIDRIKHAPIELPHKKALWLVSLGHCPEMQIWERALCEEWMPGYIDENYADFFYKHLTELATRFTKMQLSPAEFLRYASQLCATARIQRHAVAPAAATAVNGSGFPQAQACDETQNTQVTVLSPPPPSYTEQRST